MADIVFLIPLSMFPLMAEASSIRALDEVVLDKVVLRYTLNDEVPASWHMCRGSHSRLFNKAFVHDNRPGVALLALVATHSEDLRRFCTWLPLTLVPLVRVSHTGKAKFVVQEGATTTSAEESAVCLDRRAIRI